METESSSPCLQQPNTCVYPQPDQFSPCPRPFHYLKIHHNVILYQISTQYSIPLFLPNVQSVSEGTLLRFTTTVVPTQQAKISLQTIGDITIGKDRSVLCPMVRGKSVKSCGKTHLWSTGIGLIAAV